jgi:hypothetical protein
MKHFEPDATANASQLADERMLTIQKRIACSAGLTPSTDECVCPTVHDYREDVNYLIKIIQALTEPTTKDNK